MGQRLRDAVVKAAGPLEPGERAEIASAVSLRGPASTARQSLATGLAVGVLSAGTMSALVVPRRWGFLLTDRRLLFLSCNDLGKVQPGVEFALSRQDVKVVATPTGRLMRVVRLVDVDGEEVLSLHFPAVVRSDGEALAAALRAP